MSEQAFWVNVSPETEGGSLPPYVIEAGGLLRKTLAFLQDDLLHDDGTLAFVYGDPTDAYNGNYIKSGASGTGVWVFQPPLGDGSSGQGLGSRSVDNSSPVQDKTVTAADANGVIWVDGAAGAFSVSFDPDVLPGMGVWVRREDSGDNVFAIPCTGEGAQIKHTLTANGDWVYLKSKILTNGSTQLKRIASGSET